MPIVSQGMTYHFTYKRDHILCKTCAYSTWREEEKFLRAILYGYQQKGVLTLLSQYQNHKVTNGSLISVEELVLALPFFHLIFHANTCLQYFTISPSGHGTAYPRGLLIPSYDTHILLRILSHPVKQQRSIAMISWSLMIVNIQGLLPQILLRPYPPKQRKEHKFIDFKNR